jgi:hypothetical protein
MNPIKSCLNVIAAIILAPLMPIVALAWLAVWLTPEPQPAKNHQVRKHVDNKRFAIESKPVQADSVFSFVI